MTRKNKNTDLAKSTDASRGRALEARSARDRFDDMDRWFENLRSEFDRKFGGPLAPRSEGGFAVREPLVDLADMGREYVLKADLPGVSKEDLDLRVTAEGIELSAESTQERQEDEKDYAYRERTYRSFRRTLPFPEEVLADQVTASLKDGVLEVRLPKNEPSPRREPVQVRVE